VLRILEDVHEGVEAIIGRVAAPHRLDAAGAARALPAEAGDLQRRPDQTDCGLHHEFSRLKGERLADIRSRRRRTDACLIGLHQEARDAGRIDPALDVNLAAHCVFAPGVRMYTYFKPHGSVSTGALAELLVELTLHGLSGAMVEERAAGGGRPRRAQASA